MERIESDESGGSYFAIRRLLKHWRGGNSARSEADWREAYFVGWFIFFLSYFFTVHMVRGDHFTLPDVPILFGLLFATWLCWPVILYLNWLIAKLCWRCGLFTDLPANRVQNALIGILTTIFAVELVLAQSWTRWLAALWLVLIGLNLSAALLLALFGEKEADVR